MKGFNTKEFKSEGPVLKMVIKFLLCFSPVLLLVASDSVELENINKFNAVSLDLPALRVPRCCSSSSSSSESSESGSSSSQEKGWRVVFNDPRSKSRCSGSKRCPCGAAGSPYYCAFVAAPAKQRIPHDLSSSSSSESVPSPCSWSSFSLSNDLNSDDSSCTSSSCSSSSS